MSLIVSPLTNAKQPVRSFASINRKNALSDRLISAITPTVGVDIVSGRPLAVVSSPGLQVTDKGISLPGNGSRFLVSTLQTTSNDLTILYFGNFIGSGSDLKAGLGNTAGTQLFGFQQNGSSSSRCLLRNTDAGSVTESSFASFNGKTAQAVFVARAIGNTTLDLFTNGVSDKTTVGTASAGSASFNRAALGGIRRSTDGAAASSQLSTLLLVWDRALSDGEINAISINPWQVFKTDQPRLWVPDRPAPPIDITIGWTEDDDEADISVAATVSGAIGFTEANDSTSIILAISAGSRFSLIMARRRRR